MISTPQIDAVLEWFRSGTDDLALTARAGAGKSTTLVAGVMARPAPRRNDVTMCAFGRRNADDLIAKLAAADAGKNARAKTLHGLGLRAITRERPKVRVNEHREYALAELELGQGADEDELGAIARLAQLAKETRPDEISFGVLRDLAIDYGLADSDDDDSGELASERAVVALNVIERSADLTDGEISYSDMLWLPIVKNWRPDPVQLVGIDEAQDLSTAQLRIAAMARGKGGRIVVCGDDRQAIFGWRGAAPGTLDRVATALGARRLALTVTFRCARAIVDEARKVVPDLTAAPGAPDGVVRAATEPEMVAQAQPGDFVLSRVNADLARVCLALIRAGKRAYIVGNDLAAGIIALIRRLAPRRAASNADPIAELLRNLDRWREREIARARVLRRERRVEQVEDQAAMICALSADVDTIDRLIEMINYIFAEDGGPRVACSTVHRAKGLEADRVMILQSTLEAARPRTPSEELEELNIKYVAITRARNELIWVR